MTRLTDQSFAKVGDYLLWNERNHVEIVDRHVLGKGKHLRVVALGIGGDLFVLGVSKDRWQNVDTGGDAVAYTPRYRAVASSKRAGWAVLDAERNVFIDSAAVWTPRQARDEARRLNEEHRLSRSEIHGRRVL